MTPVDILIANLEQHLSSAQDQPVICLYQNLIAALQYLEGGTGGDAILPGTGGISITGATYTAALGYNGVKNNSSGAVVITLPTATQDGQLCVIKDELGNAGDTVHQLTVGPANVEGIFNDFAWLWYRWDATYTVWHQIG